jgi:hypothetical protein
MALLALLYIPFHLAMDVITGDEITLFSSREGRKLAKEMDSYR